MPRVEQLRLPLPAHERVAPVEEDRLQHADYATPVVARRILWASLALAPAQIPADLLTSAGEVALLVLSAAALIPLAWLIGESTEHAAEHTGAGIGGFLNPRFWKAPQRVLPPFGVGAVGR